MDIPVNMLHVQTFFHPYQILSSHLDFRGEVCDLHLGNQFRSRLEEAEDFEGNVFGATKPWDTVGSNDVLFSIFTARLGCGRCIFSKIVMFASYLGKIPILTNIFQMSWFNHQPAYPQFCKKTIPIQYPFSRPGNGWKPATNLETLIIPVKTVTYDRSKWSYNST